MNENFSPPYYAVIFISRLSEHTADYAATADRMIELASEMPGFLGVESAREEVGITVSFWRDQASIENWKRQAEHLQAQANGRKRWYDSFDLHVAYVERYQQYRKD